MNTKPRICRCPVCLRIAESHRQRVRLGEAELTQALSDKVITAQREQVVRLRKVLKAAIPILDRMANEWPEGDNVAHRCAEEARFALPTTQIDE